MTLNSAIRSKFEINIVLETDIFANKLGHGFQIKYRTCGDEEMTQLVNVLEVLLQHY